MSDYADTFGQRNMLRMSRLARRKGWRLEDVCVFVSGLLADPDYRLSLRFEAEKYNQTEAECFRSVVSRALDLLDNHNQTRRTNHENRNSRN